MKLVKFTAEKYKRIQELNLEFPENGDNITVLAGQNESGKSTVLEALECFYQEGFSDDSVQLLKNENKGSQKTTFRFKTLEGDAAKFVRRLGKKFTLQDGIEENLASALEGSTVFDEIEFTVDGESEGATLDETWIENLRGFINAQVAELTVVEESEEADEADEGVEVDPLIPEGSEKELTLVTYSVAPRFILFTDNTCDLLPDHIKLEDYVAGKGDGIKAIKNLESILDVDFSEVAKMTNRERNPLLDKLNTGLSANFEEVFHQRIHNENTVRIICDIEAMSETQASSIEEAGKDYIYFSVETRDGEPLPLRLRSKGLVWFLSFWLVLKSMNDRKHVILIDEPDNSLHVNAQEDLLKVLETIAEEYGHQIIYATHSPFLIPVNKPHRIKLVYNDEEHGVKADDITSTPLSKNKEEALLPIYFAIGCDVAKNNGIFANKNVIVEGASDMYAFRGMEMLLNNGISSTHFLPGVGTKGDKIDGLISLCTGYGLGWCLIMDNDQSDLDDETGLTYPQRKRDNIRTNVFGDDEDTTNKHVKILDEGSLEDLFTIGDIEKIASVTKYQLAPKPQTKDNEAYIGSKRKALFWKLFLSCVESGVIKPEDISNDAKNKFTQLLEFAQNCFNEQTT